VATDGVLIAPDNLVYGLDAPVPRWCREDGGIIEGVEDIDTPLHCIPRDKHIACYPILKCFSTLTIAFTQSFDSCSPYFSLR
jgi:hypothetical protein